MKKGIISISILVFIVSQTACSKLESLKHDMDSYGVSEHMPSGTVTAKGSQFKRGEVLCANRIGTDIMRTSFYVAKILTPASSMTKNQAEVLFINNAKKMWTDRVLPSHKASKSEIKLGRIVFVHTWAHSEKISGDNYRKQVWYLKRISSTDELFKGMIEAGGKKVRIKWLRIPNSRID